MNRNINIFQSKIWHKIDMSKISVYKIDFSLLFSIDFLDCLLNLDSFNLLASIKSI